MVDIIALLIWTYFLPIANRKIHSEQMFHAESQGASWLPFPLERWGEGKTWERWREMGWREDRAHEGEDG